MVDLQKSDCAVFPTTVRSGYEIWSRFINLATNQMYQEMKDIYDYGTGYMYNRGRRFEGWKDESGKGRFPHFEWVLNADRYDLSMCNTWTCSTPISINLLHLKINEVWKN